MYQMKMQARPGRFILCTRVAYCAGEGSQAFAMSNIINPLVCVYHEPYTAALFVA